DLSTHRGELAWRSSRNTGRNDRRAKRNRYCGGIARLRVLDSNICGSGRSCGDLVEPARVDLDNRCVARGERQAVRGVATLLGGTDAPNVTRGVPTGRLN